MKSLDFLNEGIAEDAHEMHLDHEVQMARQELYHAAEDAIALHKLLRHVSEQHGLEGWVSSKITLAADYLKTVREHLEYQMMSGGPAENVVAVVGDSMPVAEGGMPASVIKHKESIRLASDEENKKRFKGKTKAELAQMARRHGYGDKNPYAKFHDGVTESTQDVAEEQVNEMSTGSVATVVNPTPKNKAKVGTLFGGTYKQSKTKAK